MASYLSLKDLLTMSRVDSVFSRALRGHKHIWRNARLAFGAQVECPPAVPEARLASFLLEEGCQVRTQKLYRLAAINIVSAGLRCTTPAYDSQLHLPHTSLC